MRDCRKAHIYYKKYLLTADVYVKNELFVVEADAWNEEDTVSFKARNKQTVLELLRNWFEKQIDKGNASNLDRLGFSIEAKAPRLLQSFRDTGIGFHTSYSSNRESLLKNGLLPNGKEDLDTRKASHVLDSMKPSWIPEWVKREEAVYLYPEYQNELLWHKVRKNIDLFAVKCPSNPVWLGSQMLGGMCIFDNEADEKWHEEHTDEIKTNYGIEYWKHSCSYEQYRTMNSHYKKKHKAAHIDEILYFGHIPSLDIELIGSWDNQGTFIPLNSFQNYIFPIRKLDYNDILNSL